MKTTANIIEEYLQRPIADSEITDLTFSMIGQLMREYAQEAIKQDRINLLDNIIIKGYPGDYDLDENSIINAPKLELK